VNLPGETPTRGLELAMNGALAESVAYRITWTWLGASLQDQPDNTATASIDWRPMEKVLLGIGASYVDERSYGGGPLDDYFLLRLYGSYEIRENLTLHARVENITDDAYELSRFGTPIQGAGLGFFAGVTAEF
jgi:outer membrane receptor protein involved in Fe transport